MSKPSIQIIYNQEYDELRAFLSTKLPNKNVSYIHKCDVSNVVVRSAQIISFIEKDETTESALSVKGLDAIVWKSLPDLSSKLDRYLQLERYTSQFPLDLKNWHLREVLYNCDESIVYRAVNNSGEQVAIKRFKFLPSCLTDTLIQKHLVKLNQKLNVPVTGLVRYFEGGVKANSNTFYLVMEFLKYGTLRQALNGCGNVLPLTHGLEWFQEIAIAIDNIHRAGLIHRHLKIDNILLREDGSLALLGYGISKRILLDVGYIHEQELYCSPHYVSPEQITGDACTKASDIYSLGIILFELLTGHKPYAARMAHELMMHHVMAPIPLLPDNLSRYQGLINKMLAKDPADRFTSALDALEDLSNIAA